MPEPGPETAGTGDEAGGPSANAGEGAVTTPTETASSNGETPEASEGEGPATGSGVETTGEQRARLEGELDESLREFDGLILREQETLDERRQAEAEAGGSTGGGYGETTGGAAGESPVQTADAGASTAGGTGGSPDSPEGEPVGGEPGAPVGGREIDDSMSGRVPPDVGDGEDDDIVARQLREAATNEEDPELREKLWEEYRAYKFGEKKKPETPEPPEGKEETTP